MSKPPLRNAIGLCVLAVSIVALAGCSQSGGAASGDSPASQKAAITGSAAPSNVQAQVQHDMARAQAGMAAGAAAAATAAAQQAAAAKAHTGPASPN